MGFEKEYWQKNYSHPEEMDGIGNAKEHAKYLKSIFDLEGLEVNSLIDFGFGLGFLFKQFVKTFKPYRVYGIEPSEYAMEKSKIRYLKKDEKLKVTLKNIDLIEWSESQKEKSKHFDLGICTSVFQYLTKEEIELVLPVMAKKVKYLYFSVPTDIELDRQISEMEFFDQDAKRRSQKFYHDLISKHFAFVSNRLLESKHFFDEKNTVFTDLLFRF